MAQIARPQKVGGGHTYVEETNLGVFDIIDQEVDLDLDTIYHDYNGNIDNTNIATGAAIDGSKINFTTVTAPGIPGSAIAPNSLPADRIQVVVPPSPSVGLNHNQMAIGGSLQALVTQANDAVFNPDGTAGEQALLSVTWASRGGFVLFFGGVVGAIFTINAVGITFRLRLDNPTTGAIIRTATVNAGFVPGNMGTLSLPYWFPLGVTLLGGTLGQSAANHTLWLTSQVTSGTIPAPVGQSVYSSRQLAVLEPA